MSFAPPFAASSMSLHVFKTDLGRSSHSGSAWVTATRTVAVCASFEDMMGSIWAVASSHARTGNFIQEVSQ